jgi:hypothetical protein
MSESKPCQVTTKLGDNANKQKLFDPMPMDV